MSAIKNILPEWIRSYDKSFYKSDLLAGLTVAILLLPQSMAYSLLAGLDPVYGIYSILLALPLYALLGQQKTIAVGPAAMVAILVASSLAPYYQSGTTEYIQGAAMLSLLCGAFLFILGIIKFGFISNFISRPVISGYSFAVGLLVIVSQSKYLFDIEISNNKFIPSVIQLGKNITTEANWLVFAAAATALAILILSKRLSKRFPGPLLIMVLAIGLSFYFSKQFSFAPNIGAIPSVIPNISFDFFSLDALSNLWPSAAIMALIIYMDISTVSQVAQSQHVFNGNRELRAMGVANAAGSMIGAFPISTSFGRSLLNNQSGAKTPLASIVAVASVLLIVIAFKDVFALLPTYILAVVVISTVLSLINFKESRAFYLTDKKEFAVHVLTIGITLFIGIKEGILAGILAALALVIYRSSTPHIATLGYLEETQSFMNIKRFSEIKTYNNVHILRPDAQLFHGNINAICDHIENLLHKKPAEYVILQCSAINFIDSSSILKLKQFNNKCKSFGTQLLFSNIKGPVRDQMKKWDFYSAINDEYFFNDTSAAVDYSQGKITCEQTLVKQSNWAKSNKRNIKQN